MTSGCESADSFDPGFSAGTDLPVAGGFSPLALRVTRSIGKELGRIDTTLPGGLLADLSDVPVCPESALALATGRSGKAVQATPACPASQVGTVTVGAGSGPSPF